MTALEYFNLKVIEKKQYTTIVQDSFGEIFELKSEALEGEFDSNFAPEDASWEDFASNFDPDTKLIDLLFRSWIIDYGV